MQRLYVEETHLHIAGTHLQDQCTHISLVYVSKCHRQVDGLRGIGAACLCGATACSNWLVCKQMVCMQMESIDIVNHLTLADC